ncbi:MAG: DUF4864 domain-containing protein [Salaquimonas sp.]
MLKTVLQTRFAGWILMLPIVFLFAFVSTSLAQEVSVGAAETAATQSVVRDQLNAFKAGDHNRAYSHAAPNITNYFTTVDRFIGMVKGGYSAIYLSDSFVMGRNTIINDDIYQEVIITDPQGKQWQAVYTLRQQADGSWKITGVKMDPYNGATT